MARAKGVKSIVVDASVARASGKETATHPQAIHCRDILQAIRTAGHALVLTPMIAQEWNDHQSNFARQWRANMMAKKQIALPKVEADERLREKLIAGASDTMTVEILKDCHLLEAAGATDNTIIALDETMREQFATQCGQVSEIAPILWANPSEEGITDWVLEGAKAQPQKRLCYTADS